MIAEQVPVKYAAAINRSVIAEETAPGYRFRYIDISAVDGTGTICVPSESVTFADAPSRARRLAPRGATVISTVRTYLRAIARVPPSDESLVFSTGFAVLEPTSEVDGRYLYYACSSDRFVDEVVARSTGVSYPAINPSDLASISIRLPELSVQRRIADFLDDQVARIDNIIQARTLQRALVLEQARSRLDAAIEFDAAEHGWMPLRRWIIRIEQGWSPPCDQLPAESGQPGVLKLSAVRDGIFLASENKAVLEDYAPDPRYRIQQGDLLISRANTPELVGDSAVVTPGCDNLYLPDLLYRVQLAVPETDYVCAALRSRRVRGLLRVIGRGTSLSMAKIRGEDISALPVPASPRGTRSARLNELAAVSRSCELGRSLLDRSISRLKELKLSLITAAVTGEFDVSSADGSRVPA